MYLLDTNVVSEMRKIRPRKADPNVAAWADSVEASDLYLSVISIHELELGVLLAERRDAGQGAILRKWLNAMRFPLLLAASWTSTRWLLSVVQTTRAGSAPFSGWAHRRHRLGPWHDRRNPQRGRLSADGGYNSQPLGIDESGHLQAHDG